MVWGLVNSGSFGDFFPDGEYVGRRATLEAHFWNDLSEDVRREKYQNRPISYVAEVTEKFSRDFGPIPPHECPTAFETVVAYKSLGSFIELNGRLVAVDEALRDIIERLEPGVHQFWPIRITMPKGREYPVQYYGLRIGRFLNSFVPEKSEPGSWEDTGGTYRVVLPKKQYFEGLAMSQDVIGSAHLWRERKLRSLDVFFSDDLQAEIARAGLRIPKHYQLKAV